MIPDLFSCEHSILQQLRGLSGACSPADWPPSSPVPSGSFLVASASMLFGAQDISLNLPGVFVRPAGGEPAANQRSAEKTPAGAAAASPLVDQQRWVAIVIVPHWQSGQDEQSAAAIAGPLCAAVVKTLKGYKPLGESRTLAFTGWDEPIYAEGWASFFLNFACDVVLA